MKVYNIQEFFIILMAKMFNGKKSNVQHEIEQIDNFSFSRGF